MTPHSPTPDESAARVEHSRRQVLKGAGIAAAGLVVGAAGGAALASNGPGDHAAPDRPSPNSDVKRTHRTRVVLLGTAGGPAYLSADRSGTCTAVIYDDRVYLVDLGAGALGNLVAADLGGDTPNSALTNVRGVFITHMHSDHVSDFPALYSTAMINVIGHTGLPIKVRGPGNRGTLPRVFPASRPEPPIVAADEPLPGIQAMSDRLREAFASDLNDRVRDSNFRLPEQILDVQDISLAGIWDIDADGIPPALDAPIDVMTDGDVTITATLVDHRPTAPTFAYRFDTPDGSVVVAGDTRVSQNLIDLAQGCDVLVHEVIDPAFIEELTAALPEDVGASTREHLLASHTTIEQVGRDVARAAGAKQLVLSHFVPSDRPDDVWVSASDGYPGKLVVGRDLLEIGVGQPRKG